MSEQQGDRDQRAFWLLNDSGSWDHVDEGPFGRSYWLVSSHAGERYQVTATSCTCLDFAYRGRELGGCKHMRALQAMQRVLRARTE